MSDLVVAQALKDIREKNGGRLTTRSVVDAATSSKSPIHNRFEWDDSIAGVEYRLEQARKLIRSVLVHVSDTSPAVRAYLNLPKNNAAEQTDDETGDGEYIPVEDVPNSPQMRDVLERTMRREMAALESKYRTLSTYWDALEEMIKRRPSPTRSRRKATG